MDETNLRHLEQQFKMRVRTGCETCRIRRVKCDETKPECARCTKTGRKCAGYSHVTKSKGNGPTASAAYRNSSFLVVPQKRWQVSLSYNPPSRLSPDPLENRSFQYFQTHTLPRWTDFFASELWERKLLQLAHIEPAIKHGILALSTMHEEFESSSPNLNTRMNSFAFLQYMRAVKHSNELLVAHKKGTLDLEKVLIACVIFTCYENLAGNFQAANMHMRNGLRILKQNKSNLRRQITSSEESVANILYRFDLQGMTFSEQNSPYQYELDGNPGCPQIPDVYTNNITARNDLVGLLRCMLWTTAIKCVDPTVVKEPSWQQTVPKLLEGREKWEQTFSRYQENLSDKEKSDPKIYAGNTLLKMYALVIRIAVSNGFGVQPETNWDASINFFKTIVDLAETLPMLQPQTTTSPPRSLSPKSPTPGPSKARPIVPNSATFSSPSPPGPFETVFRVESSPPQPPPQPAPSSTQNSSAQRTPSSFSPSFELSPILPIFLTTTRCRDPIIRRRSLALLLNCRRREGVWDSLSAGMVAHHWVMQEEGLEDFEMPPDNWIPLSPNVLHCEDVPEERRIADVLVKMDPATERVEVGYRRSDGNQWTECMNAYEVGLIIGSSRSKASV